MTWGKVDTGLHRNPKIRMAGADAREVFVFILLANAEQYADGTIGATYANPIFLADALQRDEETIRNAVKRCIEFRLLRVTDSEVSIVGWDEEWRTKKSTDRVRKHRERKRKQELDKAKRFSNADETLRNEGNGLEQIDQKDRSEREEREREGAREEVADFATERDCKEIDLARTIADRVWQRQEDMRQELKGEGIGVQTRALGITDPAKLELMHRISEALADDKSAADAEADCRHVLDVLDADCRAASSLRWLDGQHWRADRYTPTLTREPGEPFRAKKADSGGAASAEEILGIGGG